MKTGKGLPDEIHQMSNGKGPFPANKLPLPQGPKTAYTQAQLAAQQAYNASLTKETQQ